MLRIGTLFSGIGAFEHALNQLGIEHVIQFACDNGEREIPLTFGCLRSLIKDMSSLQVRDFCEDYINNRTQLVSKYDYPEGQDGDYLLYAVNYSHPSTIGIDSNKCQAFLSVLFTSKKDKTPEFLTIRELLEAINQ